MKQTALRRAFLLLLATALLLGTALIPSAWFTNIRFSGSSHLGFATGGNPTLYDMKVWMYRSPFELTGSETQAWLDVTSDPYKYDDNSGYILPQVVENAADATDQFDLLSLHFGKIDNLISLNPDNSIYFCFHLKKSEHGSEKLSFYFDYADYGTASNDPRHSILIYNMDKQEIDHFEGEGLQYDPALPTDEANRALMELLEFSWCVSATAPPTAAEIAGDDPFGGSLTFSDPSPIMTDLTEISIEEFTGSGDDYYLYVRMAPRLENYGLHEHILTFFAQSYMLFDVTFSFEVH